MNGATENRTGTCEQLLEYAYGELGAEPRRAFEQHLAGCASCQAELASLERVRGAVKASLPLVEPPVNVTGALHAQLLHAAAQRAGGRGKLRQLRRKLPRLLLSPAFLAAAMFVVVGTAAGTMWWRGRVMMPGRPAATATVTEHESVNANANVSESVNTTANEKASANADDKDTAFGSAAPKAEHHAVAAKKKAVHAAQTNDGLSGLPALEPQGQPSKLYLEGRKEDRPMAVERVVPRPASAKGEEAPLQRAFAPAAPAAAAPPPAPVKATPMAEQSDGLMGGAEGYASGSAESTKAAPKPIDRRKQAARLADQGRCDEALRLYQQLVHDPSLRLTPDERLKYVDCLRQARLTQQALDELETLKREPAVASKVRREQQLLDGEVRAKAKAKPLPAAAPAEAKPAQ
jgi:anti-sigma factor RsiW